MTKLPHDGLIQLHAYLDPGNDWIMGHMDEIRNGYGPAVLRSRKQLNDRTTMWSVYYRNETEFQLRWAESPNLYLGWNMSNDALRLTADEYAINGLRTIFTIDDLDPSPWFALNNFEKSRVVDVRRSEMYDGNHILSFPWNGGDNQKWRAEVIQR